MSRLVPLPNPIRLGPYELTHKVVHQGKLGDAYRATQHGVEGFVKPLRIKQLSFRYSNNVDFVTALVDAASRVVKLHHANIVQLLDLGHVDQHYYFATEFVAGVDFGAIIALARLDQLDIPQEVLLLVALECLKALDYAHRHQCCHHNLAPQHILISWDGEIKIGDFGLCAALDALPPPLQPDPTIRHRYSAPSVLAGAPMSPAADIYALGLILYEAIARKTPHLTYDHQRRLQRRLEPLPPSAVNARLITTIEEMLHSQAPSRESSAALIHENLVRVKSNEFPSANPRQLADWLSRLDLKRLADLEAHQPHHHHGFNQLPPTDILHIPEPLPHSPEPSTDPSSIALLSSQDFPRAEPLLPIPLLELNHNPFTAQLAPAGAETHANTLVEMAAQCGAASPNAALLLGPSASGKTHLLQHVLATLRRDNRPCHLAFLTPQHQSTPLCLAGKWLVSILGLDLFDDHESAQRRGQHLAEHLELSRMEVECLFRLLGFPQRPILGPGLLQESAKSILEKAAWARQQEAPLLLAIDNLHFIDRSSYNLLIELLQSNRNPPLAFILSTSDDNYRHYLPIPSLEIVQLEEATAPMRRHFLETYLANLPISESLRYLLAAAPEPLGRIKDLIGLAQITARNGTPLEDILRMLLSLDPMRRFQTALTYFLPQESQILAWLTAYGQPMPIAFLLEAINSAAQQTWPHVSNLLAAGLIDVPAPKTLNIASPDLALAFRQGLGESLRKPIHCQIAKRLDANPRLHGMAPVQPMAQHQWAHCEQPDAVTQHALDFARRLYSGGFTEASLVHLQRALHDLRISGGDLPQRRARLQIAAAHSAIAVLQWDLARDNIERVFRAIDLRAEVLIGIDALTTFAVLEITCDNFDRALNHIEEALQIAAQGHCFEQDLVGLAEVRALWCLAYGDLTVAESIVEQATPRAPTEAQGRLHAIRAVIAARQGLPRQAIAALRLAKTRLSEQPCHVLRTHISLAEGEILRTQGKTELACESLELAYEIALESSHFTNYFQAAIVFIDTLVMTGQASTARRLLRQALHLATDLGATHQQRRLEIAQNFLGAAYRGEEAPMAALRTAYEDATQSAIPADLIRSAEFLAEALDRQGQREEAAQVNALAASTRQQRGYGVAPKLH